MTEYGSGGDLTVIMEGPFSGMGGSESKITTISAPAANWKGGTSPYSQVVAVDGVSVNTKVEIQLSMEQIQMFRDKGYDIAFTVENEDGIVTLYSIGRKPDMDCDFQVTLSGVIAV